MQTASLQEIIRQHIRLPTRCNAEGWYSVVHKKCDRGHKGPRAAFRFDGDVVGFNCFNCAVSTMYDPHLHVAMPKKMAGVLKDFDIPESEWQSIIFNAFVEHATGNNSTSKNTTVKSIEPSEIALPSYFSLLRDIPDEWHQYAIEYLRDDRGIDYTKYPFMIAEKTNHPDSKRWYGRLIIPIYKNNKLIFYQGRDLTGLRPQKYLSPTISDVLSGYEHIHTNTNDPLYITEGWFNAYHLKGVAVFGNRLKPNQVKWLNQSHRRKVVVPDKTGNGYVLANQALEMGWAVSLPDIGDATDVNTAIVKYGELFTRKTIHDNTFSDFEAKVRLGMYCEK